MIPILQGLARRFLGRPDKRTRTVSDTHAGTPLGALADMFERSRRVTVLTGAGMSVGSGLPPYRDDAGFDVGPAPVRYREFLIDPEARHRQWVRSLADAAAFAASTPNAGHMGLARLATARGVRIITQNVDGLHLRAGTPSESLVELHGSGDAAVCTECGRRTPVASHASTVARGEVPTCGHDGRFLKPAVTMFGETPLRSLMVRAEEWARDCDLFIVAGTSLSVTPSGFLPSDAHHSGATVVVVNPGTLRRAIHADLTVAEDAARVFHELAG